MIRENTPENRSPFVDRKMLRFVPYFVGRKRVLDVGAGWGEFLVFLRVLGTMGEALETDTHRASSLVARGFKVHAAWPRHAWFDGLFMSNVIEHMTVAEAQRFLGQAFYRLTSGSPIIITTANPKCLGVMTDTFWNDWQHTRPYPLPMLEEMLIKAGFEVQEMGVDENTRPQAWWRTLVRKFRTLLVGPYFEPSEIFIRGVKP